MIWGFSIIQQKHASSFWGLYRLILQSLYHTSLISPRWELDETANFRNFPKLFANKFDVFFVAFWPLIFRREKQNEVTGHMKDGCDDRYLYIDIGQVNVAPRR